MSKKAAPEKSTPSEIPSRRKFLTAAGATAAGAAAMGFPMIAKAAAPITLRFQST